MPRSAPTRARACRRSRCSPRASQVARDAHRHLERLLVVQARIDAALVRALEVGLRQPARAADAFGDVLAGQLDVHASEPRAELGVQREALLELVDDLVKPPRLDA